ncbi:hypothetical protein Glove_349g129 [Diversispora epigaea]|uniref:BTB domain-containing protein n=1 Tax=Diversispora epigaea TaxID=1348612 RepID=A0A397HDI5_9GLOM|nr:hypothetical protein Glove_349g129 [Diversispora epigaea]
MALKFFDKLSQNFIELLDDKDDYDVIIEVKNKEKSFMAHSNILKHRSSYFRKELENIQPNKNNIKTIIKSSISAQIFDVILKYIYGGIVNLENVETRFIYDLMLIANELEFEELTTKLATHLIETKTSWLKTHFSFIYHSIFINNKLEKFCNDIIVKYPNLIFEDSDYTSLPESALISLLKRDDLQIEEIKIWDYMIKWGISQNPTLPKNLVEWNKENLLTLKTTLQQCLPYIRYFHIPGNKIQPFKKILDKQLWKDLMQYLISPDRPVNSIILPARSVLIPELPVREKEPFSIIITNEHVAEISSWIDLKYPNLIFEDSDYTSLPESALISLLKRDDLQIEEIKIWDYMIKWGISQNPTLPKNLVEWNKENLLTLKTTLQQCLPYIRYFHIPGNKIQPFKKILDKQLWKDLMQYLISPDRPVNSIILPARSVLIPELPVREKEPFSIIITNEHVAEISSWIDRKPDTYSLADISYEFQLILRGSMNGFAPQTFWDKCHGHSRTVIVMKVKGTDEIFGGYNPLAWDANVNKDTWVETNDSFIFSLKNGNIENSILSRVKKSGNAFMNMSKDSQQSWGPYFGEDFNMYSPNSSNFTLDQFCVYRNWGCYEKPITTGRNFSIVDYEVFKVIKKTS